MSEIILYQPPPAFGLPNASPFCMKLETYLRMAEIPFQVKSASFTQAPNGKIPYIEHKSRLIGDSTLIIDYLKQTFGDRVDVGLSAEERAIMLAMQRLLENHLYFVMIYSRWIQAENWPTTRDTFFGKLPPVVKQIVPNLVQRKLMRDLKGHGIGRHDAQTLYEFGKQDIQVIADFLSDKPYMMGSRPTTLDAITYSFIAGLLLVPLDTPLKQFAQGFPELQHYCERMQAKYYPELSKT